jgi:hypothetical protein
MEARGRHGERFVLISERSNHERIRFIHLGRMVNIKYPLFFSIKMERWNSILMISDRCALSDAGMLFADSEAVKNVV